jgi:hypothetical protein
MRGNKVKSCDHEYSTVPGKCRRWRLFACFLTTCQLCDQEQTHILSRDFCMLQSATAQPNTVHQLNAPYGVALGTKTVYILHFASFPSQRQKKCAP